MSGHQFLYFSKLNKIQIAIGIPLLVIFPVTYLFMKFYKNKSKRNEELNEESNIVKTEDVVDDMSETRSELSQINLNEKKLTLLDATLVKKILSKICENVFSNLVMAYDILREDYDKENKQFKNDEYKIKDTSISTFKLESKYLLLSILVVSNILRENKKVYEIFNVNEDDYIYSLNHYNKINSKINKRNRIIEQLLDNFKDNSSFELVYNFPKEIKENYLKILSNTFYLNLKKVSILIKPFLENKDMSQESLNNKVNELYLNNLSQTRLEILKFFKVHDYDVKAVTLLRYYVFTLPRKDEVRKKYEEFNIILNKIEQNLVNKLIPDEFLKDKDIIIKDVRNIFYFVGSYRIREIIKLQKTLKTLNNINTYNKLYLIKIFSFYL